MKNIKKLIFNSIQIFTHQNFKKKISGGFTLIELLVVVAIIAILTGVILTSVSQSRSKGIDAGIKSNLRNAMTQAEVFYITNTVAINTYTNVCSSGKIGGVYGIGTYISTAINLIYLSSFNTNTSGTLTTATCKDSADAWVAEMPLSTSGQMWCVDSTGSSRQETTSIGAGFTCS